jgi:thiamine-phosphate pyrophosphorylase
MDETLYADAGGALADASLYFVCDSMPDANLDGVLRSALAGGVQIIQLRDKELDDRSLVAATATFRRHATEFGVPFLLNDRADLVEACNADGVHVGQDDLSVAAAREVAGAGAIVGLSTHSRQQLSAACEAEGDSRPDYLSVGPVWATPTKPGRAASGLEYVQIAAAEAQIPWFAIGGIDASNVEEIRAAGATRLVVVRAIRDASDVEGAARALRNALRPSPGSNASTEAGSRNGLQERPLEAPPGDSFPRVTGETGADQGEH